MSTLFALALRVLMTASLLLAGTGSHAHGRDLAAASSEPAAAAEPPCHGGMDATDTVPAVADLGDGHCGKDCHCPCVALPMLLPNALSLIASASEITAARRIVLPWRSATSLPSLRPPIA